MTALLLRIILLVAAVFGVGLVLRLGLNTGRRRVSLPAGLVLVTGPDCKLCAPALRALQAAGAVPTVLDVANTRADVGPVTSLPTALVVGDGGAVILRRTGRAVIGDAAALVAAAERQAGAFVNGPGLHRNIG
jgi:hypothetical protein